MIFTKVIGGLGNQMFQYAAGKALACKHNVAVKADILNLLKNKENKNNQRFYGLHIFSADIHFATETELTPFLSKDKSKIKRELQRRFPSLFNTLFAIERGAAYHPEFKHYPKNTYLKGFWQSELYFKTYEKEIRKDFQFKQNIIDACKPLSDKLNRINAVSLHIRRGDYIKEASANKYHGLCSPEYYQKAVSYLLSLQKDMEIIVFSDDIPWCKENLNYEVPVHFLETSKEYEDLYLMTQCKHNIIANSSFSWWGAWLNTSPNKIVIAPQKWFADAAVDSSDVIPDSWIKM